MLCSGFLMRRIPNLCGLLAITILLLSGSSQILASAPPSSASQRKGRTLTVIVDGVNNQGGNIELLLFNSDRGWPYDRSAAFRDIVVRAYSPSVRITIPDLPDGDYAVAVGHDVNQNHRLERNWLGLPKEQWGMSNNPRAVFRTPAFMKARFPLTHNAEIHIQLQ